MLIDIRHVTTSSYDRPVFLEPMTIRLRPRSDCAQRLLDHEWRVEPEPVGRGEMVDLDGNASYAVWFEGTHSSLQITVTSKVETLRTNPFEYLLSDPRVATLPVVYPADLTPALAPYRHRSAPSSSVDAFAQDLLAEAGKNTSAFLTLTVEKLASHCKNEVRETGESMIPAETLVAEQAACRDLAVLAMDVCRHIGLAARFVSGYQQIDDEGIQHDLHAWFEVYIPGAGWRGYDPTGGLAVADRHVALCAAADPRHAAPTSGTFRGTGVNSHLAYEMMIRAVDA